ncbi:MAG TPA: M14 family zinc carboxypeptidase [Pyrinomonadaceae bacterium]|nr:M14 family zinc carboxypeptidase [Pyrinomonadaceae bacterium]
MTFRSRFVTRYLNPLEVEAEVNTIVEEFSELCRLESLPFRSHGYQGERVEARGQHPMRVLRVTAPGGTTMKPAVLLMRSQHAREWINSLAIIEVARQLVENFNVGDTDSRVQEITRMLEHIEFLIIPESNPDGARLSFFDQGRRMWRKNLRPPENGAGCAGVDCNRNFPNFFGEAGSSGVPCAETYRGPSKLSEPETANIAALVGRERNIIFAVDSHSFGESIFRPSLSGGQFVGPQPLSAEDDATYRHLEDRMNAGIARIEGKQYDTGSTSNHAGTTDEFLFFTHHIFGFDLECGREFQPPVEEAITAALEVAEAVKMLGLCATGETGLDVAALLAQRPQEPPTDELTVAGPNLAAKSWEVEVLPPDHWRRFSVRCDPLPDPPVSEQLRVLADRSFDLVGGAHDRVFRFIASATDLESLADMGYQPVVERDLYADDSADV